MPRTDGVWRFDAKGLTKNGLPVVKPIFCSLKGLFDASDLRKQPLFL